MAANPFDQFDETAKSYDTQLDPSQEKSYRTWMNRIGHTKAAGYRIDDNFSGQDYDYRGFFQKNGPVAIGQGQHFPDEFKKPAHETFSNESRYATGEDAAKAGSWDGERFTPAQSGNPFDQFDAPVQAAAPAAEAAPEPVDTRPVGDLGSAFMEPLAAIGTGMVATPIAGLAGLGAAATKGLGLTQADPADVIEQMRGAMTYQPRTQAGQVATGAVTYPFEKLAQFGDFLGQKGADATGSPAVGAGINTATQFLPSLLIPALKGRAKPAEVPANVPRTAPVGQPAATGEAAPTSPAAAPAQRPAGLASVPAKASKVDSPETLARYEQLQSLPVKVPATRGQLTRDPVQLRNEGNVSATEAGKPIREIYADQNAALLENIDVLKGRVANKTKPAETPEQVGISVQDQALRAKLELKKKEVSDKYKAAEAAGELQGKVSPARIIKTIRSSPDATHFSWVESWLSKAKVVEKTDAGTVTRKLTLKEMEDLRQAAVARAMDGGTEGYYAGKVISAIDEATEGAGGNLYKEARAARRAQAMEFEETGAIARLVENKSRTDRATALEDTWRKTVIGGSVQDLRNVKRSLLTGGDAKTRTAGRRAWRDIKAQTIQHIKDEATKSVATNERGQPNITPAAMKRAVDSIGADKLNEIFGPGTAVRVDRILEATRTVKTVPPAGHAGSSTMSNVLAFLERGLGRLPVVGSTAAGAVNVGVKLHQMGASRRIVREAQRMPRNALAEEAAQKQKANAFADY